jgi:hypothetical protein
MTEIKNQHLGHGLRRLRYEKRLERLKSMAPFDVGCKIGLGLDDSIMLQEYTEYQIDSLMRNMFISKS